MGAFRERLGGERIANAEVLADRYADIADGLAQRLADALNRLRPYDPEYVARELGQAYEPPPADAQPPADGEIIPQQEQ